MEGRSLAAIELFVFLGLIGWLVYYQYTSSRRNDRESDAGRSESVDDETDRHD